MIMQKTHKNEYPAKPPLIASVIGHVLNVTVGLLFVLFSATRTYAASSLDYTDWKKNMRAGLEIGFGMPYGWAISEKMRKNFGSSTKFQVSPNWRFGAVWGYGFPLPDSAVAIGPDLGLFLGTNRKLEISYYKRGVVLEERYLHIPLALQITTVDQETGVQEGGVTLGYELSILLSSKCSLSGNPPVEFQDLEDTAKDNRLGGCIFLGGKMDLYKGFYLMSQFKFPITDFLAVKKHLGNKKNDMDTKARISMHAIRFLNTSFVELGLGVNIMKWLL